NAGCRHQVAFVARVDEYLATDAAAGGLHVAQRGAFLRHASQLRGALDDDPCLGEERLEGSLGFVRLEVVLRATGAARAFGDLRRVDAREELRGPAAQNLVATRSDVG